MFITEWRDKVFAYRESAVEPEADMCQRLAKWYSTWLKHNDYVTSLLPKILGLVDTTSRVLEIGPGTGALTLPIAAAVKEIVAVEPSAPMRTVLLDNLAQKNIRNVAVIPSRIEDIDIGRNSYDLAIACFSLYGITDVDKVLARLLSCAARLFVVMEVEEQQWYVSIYEDLVPNKWSSYPRFVHFCSVVHEMGILPNVEVIWASANYVFSDMNSLVEWWMHRLHIKAEQEIQLRSRLSNEAEVRRGAVGIYKHRRIGIMLIDRELNVLDHNRLSGYC